MKTQIDYAKNGVLTDEIKYVAHSEQLPPEKVMRGVAAGRIVITKNVGREIPALGIGEGLRVKVNANIGTSQDICDLEMELKKARVAEEAGAHTLMDLSTAGDIDAIRRRVLKETKLVVGTVPIYQAAIEAQKRGEAIIDMTEDDVFNVITKQVKDGVDFITVHCAVNKQSVERIKNQKRLMGIVSRGGTFIASRILHTGEENPLYTNYDYLLEIAKEYDVTLSLGDGMRPGCIHDATDGPQIQELVTIGELVQRARDAGVQTIVEGPGHVPLDQVETNVRIQKTICKGAPFYVLGPIVTDIAPGYDHIVGAIGGALAAASGVDYLCYLTPSEHIGLPDVDDVREGVIASRIAAHIGDLVRRPETASQWDYNMSKARADLDWEKQINLAINPSKTRCIRDARAPRNGKDEGCSMCGDFCAVKILKEYLK
jgi:phosphomethylpyrimidine synthase